MRRSLSSSFSVLVTTPKNAENLLSSSLEMWPAQSPRSSKLNASYILKYLCIVTAMSEFVQYCNMNDFNLDIFCVYNATVAIALGIFQCLMVKGSAITINSR